MTLRTFLSTLCTILVIFPILWSDDDTNPFLQSNNTFSRARAEYEPKIPQALRTPTHIAVQEKRRASFDKTILDEFCQTLQENNQVYTLHSTSSASLISQPLTVGVVFSGGQAPGGHAVVSGLIDWLQEFHPDCRCIGFLNGFKGILHDHTRTIQDKEAHAARHTGGFDLLGSGRDKIEGKDLEIVLNVARKHSLNGLVIVGGDDSNTNAALIADYFQRNSYPCAVIGVPKTIDGDLKGFELQLPFGFDTATKTYSELIGNVARDTRSGKKMYSFIKLMGRSASHVTLECALSTRPNLVFISEEVKYQQKTLQDIVFEICALIEDRVEQNKLYGVILIPEGLIEHLVDVAHLIEELNRLSTFQSLLTQKEKNSYLMQKLSDEARNCFQQLPKPLQQQLLTERDPHGNISVTKIETEKLLAILVEQELARRTITDGKKRPFAYQTFFFGYEGRCQYPTNFDLDYAYSLGRLAASAAAFGMNGYLVAIDHLNQDTSAWQPCYLPLLSFITKEERLGKKKPVIEKALVNIEQEPFLSFQKARSSWKKQDSYLQPGPIQYWNDQLQEKPHIIQP